MQASNALCPFIVPFASFTVSGRPWRDARAGAAGSAPEGACLPLRRSRWLKSSGARDERSGSYVFKSTTTPIYALHAGGSSLSLAQFSYLVHTEPVLRVWLPLEGDAPQTAYEHRMAVATAATAAAATIPGEQPTGVVADGPGAMSVAIAAAVARAIAERRHSSG